MYFICLSAGDMRPRMKRALRLSASMTASSSCAERRDEGGRDLEVGRHAHFRNRDHGLLDEVVADLAALQQVGERVSHLLAHAQLALGRAGPVERFIA